MDASSKLSKILAYIAKISGEREIHLIMQQLAELGKELVNADRCTVWIKDEEKQENWTIVAHGVDDIRVPMGQGLIGEAIATGQLTNIENAYEDARFRSAVDKETGYLTKSLLTVPFKNSEGVYIGAFQAINKQPLGSAFQQEDIDIITLAATYAGNALETRLLQQELVKTQEEIIETMGQIGESRSQETGLHVKRVALYSYELAKLAGLSERTARLLKNASPMHDIGKVATPDMILLKPGKLTADEFQIMKRHAAIGYEVFKKSNRELLKAAAIIAHEHHERWDGTGYPRMLSEEGIHIFGRITAIADVFDALSSDRVYKRAWTDEEIRTYFQEQKGKQFDPELVELFLSQFEHFLEIRNTYRDVRDDG